MDEARRESQHVIDDISAICNSMGKLDENDGTYMKDRDCKACLKEIQRYLNSDSKQHVARSTLGSLNIIKADLIPLIVQYCDFNDGDPELFATILRLCTNLTSSALLLFENQELPTEPDLLQLHNKLQKYLYSYKEAFAADDRLWSTLNVHLRQYEDDEVTFERLIILIRNIMHIAVDSSDDMGQQCDFDAHDMCLYRMDKSEMLGTLIHLASETQRGTEYCFHLMEIIYLMLRDQNPETLAGARPDIYKRKLDDTDPDKKRMAEISARNRRERLISSRDRIAPHRFRNTSFVVSNYRSLSNQPLLVTKPLEMGGKISLDDGKDYLRKAKNRRALSSETSMIYSDKNTKSSKVSYSLKMFCKHFVEKIYNNYMQQIKHNLIQKKAQENDESYYLWAIQFFSSFNRHANLSMENITETFSTSTLHFIQILISSYQDKIKIEKKKFHDTSKRLHLALRAYREILNIIRSIDKESPFHSTAETIKRNIFSETEYSTLLLNLFQQYDEPKHSAHYLRDLIQTNFIFLDIVQDYSKDKLDSSDQKDHFFMTRYCCPDVVKAHLEVLKGFKTNEDSTNLAILRFLERLVFDCKNDVILQQASVFRCLLNIMDYHSSLPGHERFTTLAKHLMEAFGSNANKKRWMYQELLFWKTANDIIEIENAIDPPPPITITRDDDELDQPLNTDDLPESQEAQPLDTVEDLLAELNDSDLSDSGDDQPVGTIGDIRPTETVDDLLAELNDDDLPESQNESPIETVDDLDDSLPTPSPIKPLDDDDSEDRPVETVAESGDIPAEPVDNLDDSLPPIENVGDIDDRPADDLLAELNHIPSPRDDSEAASPKNSSSY